MKPQSKLFQAQKSEQILSFRKETVRGPSFFNNSNNAKLKNHFQQNWAQKLGSSSYSNHELRMISEESRPFNFSSQQRLKTSNDYDTSYVRDLATPFGSTTRVTSTNFFKNPVTTFGDDAYGSRQKSRRDFTRPQFDLKKEKVPMSHFTFNLKTTTNASTSKNLDLDYQTDLIGTRHDKIHTASTTRRPYTTLTSQSNGLRSTRYTTESENGFFFQGRIETEPARPAKEALKKADNRELFAKPKTANVFKKQESLSSISSEFGQTKYGFEDDKMTRAFRIKKDVTAKYKSNIQIEQRQKKIMNTKHLTNEELIILNKDKLLAVVDNPNEPLKYCFVSREIEREYGGKISRVDVEFNIKLDEIVKKLRLDSAFKYIYLLSGVAVYELAHIPMTENIIIISNQTELATVENVIQNDLVRDFYEYGTKKDIVIYSKSHIGSRMASFVSGQKLTQDKYKDVLQIFDNGDQLNSEQLGKILQTSTPQNKNFSETITRFFPRKSTYIAEATPAQEQHATSRSSFRYQEVEDLSKTSTSYLDKVITERWDNQPVAETPEEREAKIQNYLEANDHLTENERFSLYQAICDCYNAGLRGTEIEAEERDDNNALQNIGDDEDGLEAKRLSKFPNIGELLDTLLKRMQRTKKKLDYLEIKKILDALKKPDVSSSHRSKLLEDLEINQLDENLLDDPKLKEQTVKKNFISENIKRLNKKKVDIEKLHKFNKELFLKNIPKNMQEKNLSRRELHSIYILYKALCEVTSQRHREYNLDDGIDYYSFKNGIYQVFLQSDEVAEKIFYTIDFNFSGFLNWDEFINAMVVIRAKTMKDKIDLFIKIADEDGNGNLSYDEIFKLAKICLKKFVTDEGDQFLDDLCEYFTRLIFSSVDISQDEEIPLQAIKEAIISGNAESDLLAMFCGADI